MTKQCKTVLNELVKLSNNTDALMCYSLRKPHITLYYNFDKFYDYSTYSHEIEGIIQQLANDGYLAFLDRGNGFKLTHKGLHRKAFEWIEIKQFLLKSVIVPIVVAAITALVTLWLQGSL